MSQFDVVITNKICNCREQTDVENVRTFVDIEIAVQFIIFITFETCDKICSKIEKSLVQFLVQWMAKSGKMSGKMIIILIYLSNN